MFLPHIGKRCSFSLGIKTMRMSIFYMALYVSIEAEDLQHAHQVHPPLPLAARSSHIWIKLIDFT